MPKVGDACSAGSNFFTGGGRWTWSEFRNLLIIFHLTPHKLSHPSLHARERPMRMRLFPGFHVRAHHSLRRTLSPALCPLLILLAREARASSTPLDKLSPIARGSAPLASKNPLNTYMRAVNRFPHCIPLPSSPAYMHVGRVLLRETYLYGYL